MSLSRIPAALRETARMRARGCCEYCRIHEDDAHLPHEADHIIAEQHHGETTADNLAFACFHCNRLKGPNLSSVDPETREITQLFNPRRDRWNEHFRFKGAHIFALTAVGRATAEILRFNADERLAPRETLLAARRYPRI